jgi:Flp pilus assembly protein TadB
MDLGGWLWLILDVVGVALLAAALIYATMLWRRRRRDTATRRARDESTREVYRRGG